MVAARANFAGKKGVVWCGKLVGVPRVKKVAVYQEQAGKSSVSGARVASLCVMMKMMLMAAATLFTVVNAVDLCTQHL